MNPTAQPANVGAPPGAPGPGDVDLASSEGQWETGRRFAFPRVIGGIFPEHGAPSSSLSAQSFSEALGPPQSGVRTPWTLRSAAAWLHPAPVLSSAPPAPLSRRPLTWVLLPRREPGSNTLPVAAGCHGFFITPMCEPVLTFWERRRLSRVRGQSCFSVSQVPGERTSPAQEAPAPFSGNTAALLPAPPGLPDALTVHSTTPPPPMVLQTRLPLSLALPHA